MRTMRVKIFAFLLGLLAILLLLLNIYPVVSSRDAVFLEKQSSMTSQVLTLSSSLAKLENPDEKSVAEVLRLLEIQGFDSTMVVDKDGTVIYDSAGSAGGLTGVQEVLTAMEGKTVFRSSFLPDAFVSVCAAPMSSQGELTGAVYITERDSERAGIISDMQQQIRYISFAVAAVSIVLTVIFSAGTLRRVQSLADSMRIVAGGDYSHRLVTRGHDELTELGNEFNMLTERLETTERQRRRFVSDASHELKTPLASIRLLSDSIVQSPDMDGETLREFVADIGHEAERLQRTTEKLLDLSRLDDDIQIVPEPVDVKQVAVDALVLLKPLADERGVHIRCDLADGCVIMATVDDMFHIVFNLMENAIKYNVPMGSVHLLLEGDENAVRFTVEDTGIGIPEEDSFNIFNRFYRVDKARSREAGGSGLGLSIVHDAVKAHGGSIAVGPNKPKGTRFIVSFPRPSEEETGI